MLVTSCNQKCLLRPRSIEDRIKARCESVPEKASGLSGVSQVVEANVYRKAGLLEKSPERAHHRVAPADLAFRFREDKARVHPGSRRHSLLKLPSAVSFEYIDGAGPDVDPAILAGLGGGDARPRAGVGGAPDGDGGFVGEIDVLPP